MIRKLIFFLVLFSFLFDISSQTDSSKPRKVYKYTVDILSISDSTFYQVIDTVLERDKYQSYYIPTISYQIRFYKPDSVGGLLFGFEGNTNKRLHLESFKLKGYFSYKNHDFFICYDTIPSRLLYKTNKSKVFKSTESYVIMEDDSWERYLWRMFDGDYYLYRTH